jgi:ABC-type glycerol-3-phosphate transport system substrate-binding protein
MLRKTCIVLLIGVFSLAWASLAFAAGEKEQTETQEEAQQEQVELTMWFGRENFIPEDAFETFEENHPNITVNTDVIPLEKTVQQGVRAYNAGNAPDLMQVPSAKIPPLVAQDMLMDVSDLMDRWEEEAPESYNNLADAAFEMGQWQGTPYGVALHIGPFWYTYRSDWFEQAGMDVPQTWDQVLEAGRQMSSGDRIGFSVIGSRAHAPVWFLSTFMSMGGQWENGVPQLDSAAGEYLLNFYQTLMEEDIAHPDTMAWNSGDMRAAFINGNAAQALIGDNIYPKLSESLEYGEQWEGKPLPARPGAEDQSRTMTLGWPYVIVNSTEHPYEASLVLRYLAQPDIVESVARTYQPTTVLPVLNSESYVDAKPWAPDFEEAFSNLVPMPKHPKQPQIYEVLLDAMQDALNNPQKDPAQMAAEYQDEIDQVVSE